MSIQNRKENSSEVKVTERAPRPGKRKHYNSGPLAFLQDLSIPGYRLFLAPDKHGKDPYYLQKLLDPTVGYTYVTAGDVNITEMCGKPIEPTEKVTYKAEVDITFYLLKQPVEWALDDRKEKETIAQSAIYKIDTESQNIKGFVGTKTTLNEKIGRSV